MVKQASIEKTVEIVRHCLCQRLKYTWRRIEGGPKAMTQSERILFYKAGKAQQEFLANVDARVLNSRKGRTGVRGGGGGRNGQVHQS